MINSCFYTTTIANPNGRSIIVAGIHYPHTDNGSGQHEIKN